RFQRDVYANLTEGEPVARGSGVDHRGPAPVVGPHTIDVSGEVDLDVSALPAGTTGRLIFRLVNNDQDFGTTFRLQVRHRPDAVTYKVSDGALESDVATATINVAPVNDPPVAANDAYTTAEDTPLTVQAPGVLGNDTDIDGGPLTAVLTTQPAHGTVTLNG